jgi:hypothetical protein
MCLCLSVCLCIVCSADSSKKANLLDLHRSKERLAPKKMLRFLLVLVQTLISQWEYQPIKRRVEKGAYCYCMNRAHEEKDWSSPTPLEMKPRVGNTLRGIRMHSWVWIDIHSPTPPAFIQFTKPQCTFILLSSSFHPHFPVLPPTHFAAPQPSPLFNPHPCLPLSLISTPCSFLHLCLPLCIVLALSLSPCSLSLHSTNLRLPPSLRALPVSSIVKQ